MMVFNFDIKEEENENKENLLLRENKNLTKIK